MLVEFISSIENSDSIDELVHNLNFIIGKYGFSAFQLLDVGHPEIDLPYHVGTTGKAWENEYKGNGFVHVDPIIPIVRRRNLPFTWGDVPVSPLVGGRRTGAQRTMEAARDFGFTDGLVVPYHFCDELGRVNSASCVFFWKDKQSAFRRMSSRSKHELHLIALYASQKLMDLTSIEFNRRKRFPNVERIQATRATLTDRERDVLSWSARGKTMSEVSEILGVTEDTIETHIRHVLSKLDAANKTHAVAKAIYLDMIDL